MVILVISFGIALLDQATKFLVMAHVPLGARWPVLSGLFNLSHVRNTGAAWGIMQGLNGVLVGVSFLMLIAILRFRRQLLAEGPGCRLAAGLMVGGIVGNLIDRVRLGYVVDFLDWHWRSSHFPSFNVADAAICMGVGLYLLLHFIQGRKESAAAARNEPGMRAAEDSPHAKS